VDFTPFNLLFQPSPMTWQDWISLNHVFDNASDSFKHDHPPPNHNNSFSAQAQLLMMSADGTSSSQRTLALNTDVIGNH
jgi:hypothetical protein